MASKDSGSAAAKRLAEQQAERNIGDIPRTDKYGNSGMGENYSGVLNKDKKKLAAFLKNEPGIHSGVPSDISKRGNIETFIPIFRQYIPKKERIGGK